MREERLLKRLATVITPPLDSISKRVAVDHPAQMLPRQLHATTTVIATSFITRTIFDPDQPTAKSGYTQSLMRAPEVSGPALPPISVSPSLFGVPSPTPNIPSTSPTIASNLMPAAVASAQTPASTEPSQMAPKDRSGPLSKSTTHLLIAAGCVGATIVIAFIIYLICRWRKGDKKPSVFRLARRSPKQKPAREPYVSAPLGGDWNDTTYQLPWEKTAWDVNSSSKSLLYQPPNALVRPDTASSSRPSFASGQVPSRSPFPPPNPFPNPSPLGERSVLFDSYRDASPLGLALPRRASVTASSPLLPIEGPRRPTLTEEKRRSSTPTIIPYVAKNEKPSPPKDSRFSWTNSQAPKTPVQPEITSRFSVATSRRSSVPRFRTVESWVGQQADHLEERTFQEYLEREIEDKISEPTGPRKQVKVGSNRLVTQGSDSPFFRQHPGTEVRLPRVSLIPSEILDTRLGPRESSGEL